MGAPLSCPIGDGACVPNVERQHTPTTRSLAVRTQSRAQRSACSARRTSVDGASDGSTGAQHEYLGNPGLSRHEQNRSCRGRRNQIGFGGVPAGSEQTGLNQGLQEVGHTFNLNGSVPDAPVFFYFKTIYFSIFTFLPSIFNLSSQNNFIASGSA